MTTRIDQQRPNQYPAANRTDTALITVDANNAAKRLVNAAEYTATYFNPKGFDLAQIVADGTGANTATVTLMGSIDGTHFAAIGTVVLSAGRTQIAAFTFPCQYVYAVLTAKTGPDPLDVYIRALHPQM